MVSLTPQPRCAKGSPLYALKRPILIKLSTLTLFLLVLGAASAQADPVINNTGITSPAVTITFEEFVFPSNTPLTTQYSSLGVTFVGATYDPQPGLVHGTGTSGHRAGNFIFTSGVGFDPFSIHFNSLQTAAAFAIQANTGTSTFTALLNGVTVETFSAPTSVGGGFFGFTNITFNEIRVNLDTGTNRLALFDTIQFNNAGSAAVPEPAGLLLLGTGLAGVAARVRRRRKK